MSFIYPVTLKGELVTLVPLDIEHLSGLQEATNDGELWKLWYTVVPKPEDMLVEINRRLGLQKTEEMLPFTIMDNTGKVLGMTTYMNVDAANRRLEIGYTWYRQSVQKTLTNTEAKLLLLTHAFEKLDCIAVEFRTSSFNMASRRAIERLGARLDGIIRNSKIQSNGLLRDSYVYSIINTEWPSVKHNLEYKLGRLE